MVDEGDRPHQARCHHLRQHHVSARGEMSEEESWGPAKRLVRKHTSKKIGQIWLHHTGHDGSRATAPRPANGKWTRWCG